MRHPPRGALHWSALALVLTAAACDPSTIATPAASAASALGFLNGPSELPQVLRFEQRMIAGWPDLERNTAIIVGAPQPPELSRLCGGPARAAFVPIQLVGDLDGVVKGLLLEPDVSVLVYDETAPTLVDALCGSEPYGTGRGSWLRSDNDLFGTGGNRTNAFSDHVQARVTLEDGRPAEVSASIRGIGRDNALVMQELSVRIQPRGP